MPDHESILATHPGSIPAYDIDHYPAWRRVLLGSVPIAALAFFMGIVFDHLSGQVTPFDTVAYPLGVVGLLAVEAALFIWPKHLKAILSTLVGKMSLFFLAKLVYLLFFAAPEVSITAEMTESLFWAPTMYVISFLIPGLTLGRRYAMSYTVAMLAISTIYALGQVGAAPAWSVLYALLQLNLANIMLMVMTRTFIIFKEHYTQARTHGETLAKLAQTDTLTGLPNRRRLDYELATALGRARQHKQQLAVVFIDLDRFKVVNDTLGHEAGDTLLVQVAKRLQTVVRHDDLLARISGDEFVLLIEDADAAQLPQRLTQLREAVAHPFTVAGQPLSISASLGYCLYPDDGMDTATLLRHADSAMYQVKASGRNNLRRFVPSYDAQLEDRRTLEKDLRHALTAGELQLHYQPILELRSGRLCKVEALLRWSHPERGAVSPEVFIPIAEESGLIHELGVWVLHAACQQAACWQQAGYAPITVCVNVSPLQFAQPEFYGVVKNILAAHALAPRTLELEITESVVLDGADVVTNTLLKLQRLGVSTAIDDFGSGHSGFGYLRYLPITTLKIDRSFVADLAKPLLAPHYALALVQAIVTVAKTLDLQVVAEGIEGPAELELLKDLGVDAGQGYYFAKPLPASALGELLLPSHVQPHGDVPHRLAN